MKKLLDMLQFLKTLPLLFYSAPFYRHLVHAGRGLGFSFLLTVSLIGGLGALKADLFGPLQKEFSAVFAALPTVTIKDGLLSLQESAPQIVPFWQEMEGGPYYIVFDPTVSAQEVSSLQQRMRNEKIIVFVTAKDVILRNPETDQTDLQSFRNAKDVTISHEKWIEIGRAIASFTGPGLIVSFVLFLFLSHLITAFFGAVLLSLIGLLLSFSAPFSAFLRLASAAKVPGSVLALFVTPSLPLLGMVWFGFACFGLLAARQPKG